jgi:predicted amidohydrolase YtcJ
MKTASIPVVLGLLLVACATPTSNRLMVDTLYLNGDIYTANPLAPKAQAFAVLGGEIVIVGSVAEAQSRVDARRAVDLKKHRI